MTAGAILALFGVGLAVGFLSGLIGIGGGVLIVPFLYFVYAHPGWSGAAVAPGLEAAVAHATSLFIIVPTAIRGTLAYQRARLVEWRSVLPIAVASMLAAVAGARLALVLPAPALKLAFGVLLIASAVQLATHRLPAHAAGGRPGLAAAVLTGALVGTLSALLGVGGGLVAIPLLIYLVRVDIARVSATSLALVAFSATAGVATYMASGWGAAGLPPGSVGYVHVLAALPMIPGALLAVAWGARINQRTPAHQLRWIFAIFFAVMGIRLIATNAGALW